VSAEGAAGDRGAREAERPPQGGANGGAARGMKSSGFFVSRGALQSEEQVRRMEDKEERRRSEFEEATRRDKKSNRRKAAAADAGTSRQTAAAGGGAGAAGAGGEAGGGAGGAGRRQDTAAVKSRPAPTDSSQWKALCRISAMMGAPVAGDLAFTRQSFTPKLSCTSLSALYCPLYLHCSHYCHTIARLMRNKRPPIRPPPYGCHHHRILAMAISCKGQQVTEAKTEHAPLPNAHPLGPS